MTYTIKTTDKEIPPNLDDFKKQKIFTYDEII